MSRSATVVAPRHGTHALAALLCVGWPAAMLAIFVAVPFVLMVRVSLAPFDTAELWGHGVTLKAFAALNDHGVGKALFYSVTLALAVAIASIAIAYPLTWFISRMRKRMQVCWLIFLLTTLSLSDVLVTFSWQVMLARRLYISQFLIWLGVLEKTDSLVPGIGAVLCSLLYISIPFGVLLLYPALSRLDQSIVEAARTMGATATRTFFGVVVPMTRAPIIMAIVLSMVSAMGAYTAPLVLGRPETWTLSVLIGKTALSAQDFPASAAMAVVLLAVTLLIGGICSLMLKKEGRP